MDGFSTCFPGAALSICFPGIPRRSPCLSIPDSGIFCISRRHHPRSMAIVAVGTAENKPAEKEDPSKTQTKWHIKKNTAGEMNHRQMPPAPVPRARSTLAATLCSAWEDIINKWLEARPLRPSVDPGNVLAGNFAPVHELPPTPCPVVRGCIPASLRGGAYVRNGPNPQHVPLGAPHHLFDGDGMLHSLLLSADHSGRSLATLCSRFVRTHKYAVEKEAGGPVFPKFFTFHGLAAVGRSAVALARIVTNQISVGEGMSTANISLAFFHGGLFALGEPDLPYVVRLSPEDGEVSTVGQSNFDGRLSVGMTAHPKKDTNSGEVFAFRRQPIPPFLSYFRFDEEGRKQPDVSIYSARRASFFHDFAITKRYAVFPDIQLVLDPLSMALGKGAMFRSDPGNVPRVGVIPRRATSGREMRWFDVPGFNPMHTLNAWDEEEENDGGGRTVVLVAPNLLGVEHQLERPELVHYCVEMVRIDLQNSVVTRRPLSVKSLDMGVINPAYAGRKNRYSYLALGGIFPKATGVAKLDFELAKENKDCLVACREYEPGCFGGEPFFVARDGATDEDDGYVVNYMHNENSGESTFMVMDAKSPELEVVAEVLLPRRVPYGFHGVFITQRELRNQQL